MTAPVRNRIKDHRRVRAGDLVPHEMNFRRHPDSQKSAMRGVYDSIGFARSLLVYELPDGRLKLIDGHLRQELTPDMEVDVEVLDVTDDEAKLILATLDPLAALAQHDAAALDNLLDDLQPAIEASPSVAVLMASLSPRKPRALTLADGLRYQVIVQCGDEHEQRALLDRFAAEGLTCKALIS